MSSITAKTIALAAEPGTVRLVEVEAAEQRAAELKGALRRLKAASEKLELVRKHTKSGQVWRPELLLKKSDSYSYHDIPVAVPISAGLIQQTVLNEYYAAKREVILLGGDPRDAENLR